MDAPQWHKAHIVIQLQFVRRFLCEQVVEINNWRTKNKISYSTLYDRVGLTILQAIISEL